MSTIWWNSLTIIVPLVLLLISYFAGDFLALVFNRGKGIAVKILSGFIFLLCLFHLISLPFMFTDLSVSLLTTIFLCALGLLFAVYFILLLGGKKFGLLSDFRKLIRGISDNFKNCWWQYIIWLIVIGLIYYQVYVVMVRVMFNVDDNFYVAESLNNITRNRLMSCLPGCGIEGSSFPPAYLLVSWEAFISILCRIFSTEAALMCHSILPVILIPLHYMAYYLCGREFGKGRTAPFMLFVVLLNLFSGPQTYCQGAFLNLRIWQGKAVLVNLIFPLLLYVFIRITKEKRASNRNLCFLFALLLASQAASTVGVYLTPVLYASYAIAFLIITAKWKEFFRLLIPGAAIIPFILWKLLLLVNAGNLGSYSEGSGVNSKTYFEIITDFFGWSLVPVLFLIALILLLLKKRNKETDCLKYFFLISFSFLLIFFLNPFVKTFAEKYVTGVGVYWRLFWLLQTTLVIAAGFAELCNMNRHKITRAVMVLLCCFVLVSSGTIFTEDEDVKEVAVENPYKISNFSIALCDAIEDDVKNSNEDLSDKEIEKLLQKKILMTTRNNSKEIRQYKDIALMHYVYVSNNYKSYMSKDDYKIEKRLYNRLYNSKTWESEADFISWITRLKIDYFIIETKTKEENNSIFPASYELLLEKDGYQLYKTAP